MSELEITAVIQADQIADISINDARPSASRLLVGRPADEAPDLVESLFAACHRAQSLASQLAIGAARGHDCACQNAEIHSQLAIEALQEQLRLAFIEGPKVFENQPRVDQFVQLYKDLDRGDIVTFTAHFMGDDIRERVLGTMTDLEAVLSFPEKRPALLPQLNAAAWSQELRGIPDLDFCRFPVYRGRPAETGPLARHHTKEPVRNALENGRPLSARALALSEDMLMWLTAIVGDTPDEPFFTSAGSNNVGFGVVETARGTLIHAVRLDGNDQIVDYAICAPTEWNFHPDGSLKTIVQGLNGAHGDLKGAVNAATLLLNPCVEYALKVANKTDA